MTTIFREPLIAKPPCAQRSPDLATWVGAGSIALLTAIAAIPQVSKADQADQAIPQKVVRPIELATWVQAPSIALTATNPTLTRQQDFPTPIRVTRPESLKTWTLSPNPVAPGPPAIRQYDFPTPKLSPRPTDLQTWTQSPRPVIAGTPFSNYDFPVPVAKTRPTDLQTSVSLPAPLGDKNTYLFREPLVARPAALRKASAADTWVQSPIPAAAVTGTPVVNYDQSVPRSNPRSVDLSTWTQGFRVQDQVVVFLPCLVEAWDVPQPAPRSVDLATWIQQPPPAGVAGTPVTNYDQSVPRTTIRPISLGTHSQTAQLTPPIIGTPFANFDFPTPPKAPASLDTKTWTQGPQAVPPGAPPITQTDFPVPNRVPRPTDLNTCVSTNINLQPPSVAPLDTGSAGDRISGGYFSRKKWHALIGELAKEAHERADQLKRKKERETVAVAIRASLKAAEDADVSGLGAEPMAAIAATLGAATRATKTAEVLAHVRAIHRHVAELKRQIDENDDEEVEAVELLWLL